MSRSLVDPHVPEVHLGLGPGSGKVRSRISGIRLGDRLEVTGDLLEKMAALPLDGGAADARFLRPEEPEELEEPS